MKRSRLCNKFLENKSQENRMLYTKQRIYCVSLLRRTKIRYYVNLDENKILDNKQFWKLVKPLFSDKSVSGDKINLTKDGEHVEIELKTEVVLNNFFSKKVKSFNIAQYSNVDSIVQNIE